MEARAVLTFPTSFWKTSRPRLLFKLIFCLLFLFHVDVHALASVLCFDAKGSFVGGSYL